MKAAYECKCFGKALCLKSWVRNLDLGYSWFLHGTLARQWLPVVAADNTRVFRGCVGCIARCEMQAVMRHSDRGVKLVTLFTQTIWHVTPTKYTNNCHCTCKSYDYCPVGANNVVVSAGAEHEL